MDEALRLAAGLRATRLKRVSDGARGVALDACAAAVPGDHHLRTSDRAVPAKSAVLIVRSSVRSAIGRLAGLIAHWTCLRPLGAGLAIGFLTARPRHGEAAATTAGDLLQVFRLTSASGSATASCQRTAPR